MAHCIVVEQSCRKKGLHTTIMILLQCSNIYKFSPCVQYSCKFLPSFLFLFLSLYGTYYVHSEEIPSADIYIFIVIILSTIYLHSFFTLFLDLRGYFYIIESHEYQIHFAISTSLLYGNAREKCY